MINKKYIIAFIILGCLSAFSPLTKIAHAQTTPPPVPVTSNPSSPTAQGDAEGMYTYIAPLGENFTGTIDLRDENALTNYLQKWFRFAIGLAGVFGVIRLVLVGFEIVAGAPSASAESKIKKEIFAIVGSLLLIAGSWIFLNTINPQLVNQNLLIPMSTGTGQMRTLCTDQSKGNCIDTSIGNTNGQPGPTDTFGRAILADNVTKGLKDEGFYYLVNDKASGEKYWVGKFDLLDDCVNQATKQYYEQAQNPNATFSVILAEGAQSPSCMNYTTNASPAFKQTEEGGRAILAQGGVAVNKSFCVNSVAKGCTNVTGLASEVFANLTGFAGNCMNFNQGKSCDVVLTGGTEGAGMHKTHGLQFNYTYDMSASAATTNFLKNKAEYIAPSFSKISPNVRYLYNGWWYNYEGAAGATTLGTGMHYHVCMNNAPGIYTQDKYWACNEKYLNVNDMKVYKLDLSSCSDNPNNPLQKLCLGAQVPN